MGGGRVAVKSQTHVVRNKLSVAGAGKAAARSIYARITYYQALQITKSLGLKRIRKFARFASQDIVTLRVVGNAAIIKTSKELRAARVKTRFGRAAVRAGRTIEIASPIDMCPPGIRPPPK